MLAYRLKESIIPFHCLGGWLSPGSEKMHPALFSSLVAPLTDGRESVLLLFWLDPLPRPWLFPLQLLLFEPFLEPLPPFPPLLLWSHATELLLPRLAPSVALLPPPGAAPCWV